MSYYTFKGTSVNTSGRRDSFCIEACIPFHSTSPRGLLMWARRHLRPVEGRVLVFHNIEGNVFYIFDLLADEVNSKRFPKDPFYEKAR